MLKYTGDFLVTVATVEGDIVRHRCKDADALGLFLSDLDWEKIDRYSVVRAIENFVTLVDSLHKVDKI